MSRRRKTMRPETVKALGEMVRVAAKAVAGVDVDPSEIGFTVCGSSWCAGSEAGAAEGDSSWADDLDFESLHAPEYPESDHANGEK